MKIAEEPHIKVGLLSDIEAVKFELVGQFTAANGARFEAGEYLATVSKRITGPHGTIEIESSSLTFTPVDFAAAKFLVHDVVIGINFHWQRKETQTFQGALKILFEKESLTVINELPLEAYLASVISSEMSAACPPELLRAHAIVSRSWLLAQLLNQQQDARKDETAVSSGVPGANEILRWYDRENHERFDVCADDHCQRYQGISKAFTPEAFAAIQTTRGVVLQFDNQICDARYSKSCGGISEVYRAAWEDKEVPYLTAVYDWQGKPKGFPLPLTGEENAEKWICSSPVAYCNTDSKELLSRILTGFDQETLDFYRWRVTYSQAELQELLTLRTGIDFGRIRSLAAIERGESGRIIRLKIVGEKRTMTIGKELEIRRALSSSHLYSSSFVVQSKIDQGNEYPASFDLIGAGWGHGVGLCQIGAAVMADNGFSHQEILFHYFKGTELGALY